MEQAPGSPSCAGRTSESPAVIGGSARARPNPLPARPHGRGTLAWSLVATPGIPTTPRHWLAGSCADRAGAQPLRTPRCPGPAPAPTSTSAPAVGHRPPGHSGTFRTSGLWTFRADGARGPVRSGLAAPRPTGGRGRRTSQKIPVLCGDPSPKTLGPSQVSDSALRTGLGVSPCPREWRPHHLPTSQLDAQPLPTWSVPLNPRDRFVLVQGAQGLTSSQVSPLLPSPLQTRLERTRA